MDYGISANCARKIVTFLVGLTPFQNWGPSCYHFGAVVLTFRRSMPSQFSRHITTLISH